MSPETFDLNVAAFSRAFWGVGEASRQFCGIRKIEIESFGDWTKDPLICIRS